MVEKTHAEEPLIVDEPSMPNDDYLLILETVKRQYEEYAEVSDLYKLPYRQSDAQVSYQPPGREHPLTSNTIHLK